jgi:hypothetical protein
MTQREYIENRANRSAEIVFLAKIIFPAKWYKEAYFFRSYNVGAQNSLGNGTDATLFSHIRKTRTGAALNN